VSIQSIGDTLNALVGGVRAAKFQDEGHRFDVRVRLVSDQRSRPEDVKRLFVRNREGKLIRLSEVVQIHEAASLQTITRRNRARSITIRANMAPGASQKTANDLIQSIAEEVLPAGYGLEVTGSSRLFQEGVLGFGIALGLGVLIAYMVLASQFNSFIHPFLVLLAMPFSVTGAFVAMWWADVSFNMYSMIGLVLLMGIVKKNSILLVEFTNRLREQDPGEAGLRFGLKRLLGAVVRWDGPALAEYMSQRRARRRVVTDALLEACPIRLRPILMTSISTIAAAIPAALAVGPGAESRIPMAIVVIGGMTVSTLFTLFVVPCAYRILPGRVHKVEVEEPASQSVPVEESAVPGR
jgi:HAE1 family hydrophobic/amphiphilic exporter-1